MHVLYLRLDQSEAHAAIRSQSAELDQAHSRQAMITRAYSLICSALKRW